MPSKEKAISLLMHESFLKYKVRISEVRLNSLALDLLAFLKVSWLVKVLSGIGDFLVDL